MEEDNEKEHLLGLLSTNVKLIHKSKEDSHKIVTLFSTFATDNSSNSVSLPSSPWTNGHASEEETLQMKVNQLQSEKQQLLQTNEWYRERIEGLNNHNLRLQQELNGANMELQTLARESKHLKEECNMWKTQVEQDTKTIQEKEEVIQKFKATPIELRPEDDPLANLIHENEELTANLDKLLLVAGTKQEEEEGARVVSLKDAEDLVLSVNTILQTLDKWTNHKSNGSQQSPAKQMVQHLQDVLLVVERVASDSLRRCSGGSSHQKQQLDFQLSTLKAFTTKLQKEKEEMVLKLEKVFQRSNGDALKPQTDQMVDGILSQLDKLNEGHLLAEQKLSELNQDPEIWNIQHLTNPKREGKGEEEEKENKEEGEEEEEEEEEERPILDLVVSYAAQLQSLWEYYSKQQSELLQLCVTQTNDIMEGKEVTFENIRNLIQHENMEETKQLEMNESFWTNQKHLLEQQQLQFSSIGTLLNTMLNRLTPESIWMAHSTSEELKKQVEREIKMWEEKTNQLKGILVQREEDIRRMKFNYDAAIYSIIEEKDIIIREKEQLQSKIDALTQFVRSEEQQYPS